MSFDGNAAVAAAAAGVGGWGSLGAEEGLRNFGQGRLVSAKCSGPRRSLGPESVCVYVRARARTDRNRSELKKASLVSAKYSLWSVSA